MKLTIHQEKNGLNLNEEFLSQNSLAKMNFYMLKKPVMRKLKINFMMLKKKMKMIGHQLKENKKGLIIA